MERTDRAAVLPVDFGWSDAGTWTGLWELASRDADGNATIGDVLTLDTSGSYIRSEGPLVTTLGVTDLVVVATADAVLVAAKGADQGVSKIVSALKAAGTAAATESPWVHRPWGFYQLLHAGERFQVKQITVNPGARLSLQRHRHRAEHWVVVNGSALVTRDGEEFTVAENESVFLPKGCLHRLENRTADPLNLIEVQSGSYLGEDDIERIEDDYARTAAQTG
jgi:mannose-1-phosphate guanylyltransferase/mannose-1-phosphate guanylyltransferase/mannose-6-phosphate isomerase